MKQRQKDILYIVVSLALSISAIGQAFALFAASPGTASSPSENTASASSASLLQPVSQYMTAGGVEESGYIYISPSSESGRSLFQDALSLMKASLSDAEFTKSSLKESFPGGTPALVLQLGYTAGRDVLSSCLDIPEENLPSLRFDQIWIAPATAYGQKPRFGFYRSTTASFYTASGGSYFQTSNTSLIDTMSTVGFQQEKHYLRTDAAWPDAFEGDFFVPDSKTPQTALSYQTRLHFTSLDAEEGSSLYAYAMSFFDNASTVSHTASESSVLFANEKFALKVDEGGLVTYVNTPTDAEKEGISLSQAYEKAAAFLTRDLARQGSTAISFFLSDYQVTENGAVFFFDYQVGGYPCRLPDVKKEKFGLEHAVKVSVQGSVVRRCERYLLDVFFTGESGTLTYSWMDIMNQYSHMGYTLTEPPSLCYELSLGRLMLLYTIETTQGTQYVYAGRESGPA